MHAVRACRLLFFMFLFIIVGCASDKPPKEESPAPKPEMVVSPPVALAEAPPKEEPAPVPPAEWREHSDGSIVLSSESTTALLQDEIPDLVAVTLGNHHAFKLYLGPAAAQVEIPIDIHKDLLRPGDDGMILLEDISYFRDQMKGLYQLLVSLEKRGAIPKEGVRFFLEPPSSKMRMGVSNDGRLLIAGDFAGKEMTGDFLEKPQVIRVFSGASLGDIKE